MGLLTAETPLSSALEQHPALIPLISRFGIRLGLGDKTVATVCGEHGIDTGFLLTLMNTFLFEEYFPEQKLKTFHISQIIDYLSKTNAYYLHFQLPNIERHLGSLIASAGGENKNLTLLGQFFGRFKESLTQSIRYDSDVWFPYCLSLSTDDPSPVVEIPGAEQQETLIGMLRDLLSIMVRHLTGQYNDNLAYAVIFAITSIERDIRQHSRIRHRILLPAVQSSCSE